MVETSPGSMSRLGRVERWVPGVRVLRTYDRAWLPRDLIAGVVLVTLLVPQGMAYAELAGLPPITGLYTTVVCLVAYAFVGPSPVLVLGPDSSLGPMIAATILPLAAGDEQVAIALAGMLALMVGLVTVGAGLRTARLRRGPALEPGPDRLPGGTRGRDLRRPAAEAVRVLDRRERARRRGRRLPRGPRPDEPVGARDRPAQPRRSSWASSASRRGRPASSSPSWSRSCCRSCSTSPRTACRVIGVLPQGFPVPGLPGRAAGRHPAAVRRRGRHLARRDRRHDLDLRRASPLAAGYEVDGNQELAGIGVGQPRRGPLLGLPGEHERLADRRRRPVGCEDPADRPRRRGARAR